MTEDDALTESENEENSDIYTNSGQPHVRPHQNPETLRKLYHEEDLTQAEVGERLGVDQRTISKWMRILEIETEPPAHKRRNSREGDIYPIEHDDGKIQYLEKVDGESQHCVYRHQVVALLEFDPEVVFDPNTHVHHLMNTPTAVDVPENLDVLNVSDHLKRHAEGTATDSPETVLSLMRDEFEPQIGSPSDGDDGGGDE